MNILLYPVLLIAVAVIVVIVAFMTRRKKPSERELLEGLTSAVEHLRTSVHHVRERQEFLIGIAEESNFHLIEVLQLLQTRIAKSATIQFFDEKGNRLMPAQLQVGQTATAVLHEFTGANGAGLEVPPVGPVTYSSSDPSVATVDAATGVVTAVATGTATITGTDAGNGLSASDIVTDQPVAAQSATLVITVNP